jgi:hypothetical protein
MENSMVVMLVSYWVGKLVLQLEWKWVANWVVEKVSEMVVRMVEA